AGVNVDTPVPRLAGQDVGTIIAAMQAFRSGQRPATVMDRIARGFSDAESAAIAAWFVTQKEPWAHLLLKGESGRLHRTRPPPLRCSRPVSQMLRRESLHRRGTPPRSARAHRLLPMCTYTRHRLCFKTTESA